jgi:hypothetical protein
MVRSYWNQVNASNSNYLQRCRMFAYLNQLQVRVIFLALLVWVFDAMQPLPRSDFMLYFCSLCATSFNVHPSFVYIVSYNICIALIGHQLNWTLSGVQVLCSRNLLFCFSIARQVFGLCKSINNIPAIATESSI